MDTTAIILAIVFAMLALIYLAIGMLTDAEGAFGMSAFHAVVSMFILLVGTFIWLSNGDRDPGYERCTQYAEMMEVDSKYDMDNHWCFVKVNDQWVEVEP